MLPKIIEGTSKREKHSVTGCLYNSKLPAGQLICFSVISNLCDNQHELPIGQDSAIFTLLIVLWMGLLISYVQSSQQNEDEYIGAEIKCKFLA